MRPDYDLSGLEPFQAALWVSIQESAILAEIRAYQAKRQGFAMCGGGELEELMNLFPQPVSPTALPAPPLLMCPYAVSLWMQNRTPL
jgi:hypothetical protein